MAFSAWMIRTGARRPFQCPDAYWWRVLAVLAADPKAKVALVLRDGEWSHEVKQSVRFRVDEHNGPHLLLAEDDTAQSF